MKELLKKNIINLRGQSLKKKLVVIESDDWGSIRIPSQKVAKDLISKGLLNEQDPFDTVDSLETEQDLQGLLDVLNSHKDHVDNSPVLTANMVMANPDFEAIKESGFSSYTYEVFTETYKRNPTTANSFKVLQQGVQERLIAPQFHAREHLNSILWMQYLQNQREDFHVAFDQGCFSIKDSSPTNRRKNIMATYDYYSTAELKTIQESIKEGVALFEAVFHVKSETTIAPCYVWDSKIEKTFNDLGIDTFQGSKYQNMPLKNTNKFTRKLRYMGQKERDNTYLIRNCLFEPAINNKIDWVDACMESIRVAFFWKKPAIIGSHRINFSGGINPKNRETNLRLLDSLLSKIVATWPDVEFISSAKLTKYYQ